MALKISGTNVIDDSLVAALDATYVKTMTVSAQPPNVIGTSYAYTSGGIKGESSPTDYVNTIDRFPFSTPFTAATAVGYLTPVGRGYSAGESSDTYGYTSSGWLPYLNTIDRFPFSTPFTTATDVGDSSTVKFYVTGQSSSSDGYISGGNGGPPGAIATIDRFPFSTPFTTATNTGSLSVARGNLSGTSSSTDGYSSGGAVNPPTFPPWTNVIDRFPFSTPFVNATDIGDIIPSTFGGATGNNSTENGYASANLLGTFAATSNIYKFPFSTPFTTATNIGDLSQDRSNGTAQSSETYGYVSGGSQYPGTPPTIYVNTIDRFPFSTPFTTATDVGYLTQSRSAGGPQQD